MGARESRHLHRQEALECGGSGFHVEKDVGRSSPGRDCKVATGQCSGPVAGQASGCPQPSLTQADRRSPASSVPLSALH